jgi:hypothetical protein
MKDRWPPKEEARIAGIDDGPFDTGSLTVDVIITIMRLDGYIEGFIRTSITKDGYDSATRIVDAIKKSRFSDQIRFILSDGACLGGFNVLDIRYIHEQLEVPVITCSSNEPEPESMKKALIENLKDGRERFDLVSLHETEEVRMKNGKCFIRSIGIPSKRAKWLVEKITIRGNTPEPIRISHMVASIGL